MVKGAALGEAALAGLEVLERLCEQATGQRAVRVKGDSELAQCGEQVGLKVASERVVLALVDGGQDIALGGRNVVDGLDGFGREVGYTETAEEALAVGRIDACKCLFKGRAWVGEVQVKDVDLLDTQTGNALASRLEDKVLGGPGDLRVAVGLTDAPFGVDCELVAGLGAADSGLGVA